LTLNFQAEEFSGLSGSLAVLRFDTNECYYRLPAVFICQELLIGTYDPSFDKAFDIVAGARRMPYWVL